jgi:hypothetical protein
MYSETDLIDFANFCISISVNKITKVEVEKWHKSKKKRGFERIELDENININEKK